MIFTDGVSLTSNVLAQSKWNNITKEMEETVNAINKAVKVSIFDYMAMKISYIFNYY